MTETFTRKAGETLVSSITELFTTRLSEVEAKQVEWLWPGYIALGKLTLLIGDPGVGKSQVTLDVAARVTTGRTWPCGDTAAPLGDVIVLQAEDDLADTMRPRFDALGGDPARLTVINGARHGASARMVSLERDLEALRPELRRQGVRLFIIDPLMAYLGSATDPYKDADVRRVLTPLVQVAAETGVAVVAVMHLNKKQDLHAVYRAGGSIAFVAVARVVLAVAKDPHDADRRLVVPVKANIAAGSTGLAFRVTARGLEWEPKPVSMDAQVLSGGAAERLAGKREAAATAILLMLAHGPMPVGKVKAELEKAGYSSSTVDRAAGDLSLQTIKVPGVPHLWSLPTTAASAPEAEGDDDARHQAQQ